MTDDVKTWVSGYLSWRLNCSWEYCEVEILTTYSMLCLALINRHVALLITVPVQPRGMPNWESTPSGIQSKFSCNFCLLRTLGFSASKRGHAEINLIVFISPSIRQSTVQFPPIICVCSKHTIWNLYIAFNRCIPPHDTNGGLSARVTQQLWSCGHTYTGHTQNNWSQLERLYFGRSIL